MSRHELTPKQYVFCSEYIKNGFNAYQAALTAGYSPSYAHCKTHELVEHPMIKQRIEQAFNKLTPKLDVTFEWRINKLKRLVNAIIPDGEGEVKVSHGKTAVSALAEINKMYGDYAPEKRLNMTVNATLDKLNEARKAYEEY